MSPQFKRQRDKIREERKKMLAKHKTRFDDVKGIIPVKRTSQVCHRETQFIPSHSADGCTGVAAAREQKVYTGTKLVGIATMHKSNMVPVFSKDEATEVSRMRRG